MKVLEVFLICLLVIQITAVQEGKKQCGPQLAIALTDACKNGYIGLPLGKRTVNPKFIAPSSDSDIRYPYFASSLSNIFDFGEESFEDKLRRTRNIGIVEYCCKEPCTIQQLEQYCK